jgi:hypothetical protein
MPRPAGRPDHDQAVDPDDKDYTHRHQRDSQVLNAISFKHSFLLEGYGIELKPRCHDLIRQMAL